MPENLVENALGKCFPENGGHFVSASMWLVPRHLLAAQGHNDFNIYGMP